MVQQMCMSPYGTYSSPRMLLVKPHHQISAIDQSITATLSWGTSEGAESYEYCYDSSNNDSCDDNWVSIGLDTSVELNGLLPLRTYYWQVQAINPSGTVAADVGDWWSFTTLPLPSAEDGFNPNANGGIYSLAQQIDGKIIVGGSFTTINGENRDRIARLNPDGSLDMSFNPGANNGASALAIQVDGKILVGGSFTNIGGATRNRIARLNTDGSLDTTFNPDANGSVSSLVYRMMRRSW